MSKIGVIITDMFEDVEYIESVEALREADHEVVHVYSPTLTLSGSPRGQEKVIRNSF